MRGQASIEEVKEFQKKRTLSELQEKIELNREKKRREILMRRYYREAVSAHRKAFRAWVNWLEKSQPLTTQGAFSGKGHGKHRFPETNPIST